MESSSKKVLKKKDIYGMKFPERPLTPRRSRSDSPNRPTTPSDCQRKLDFNDDEDSYKVEADISHAACTCAQKENYYKCRISLLEKQKVELDRKLQRLEMQNTAVQNECVELLMMLQNIHNRSEISFEKFSFVIDERIFRQKLIETTSQEDEIKTEITKILQNFDPAKDKIGCINDLVKRYEKTYSTFDNVIPSDKHTDMKDNTTTRSCKLEMQNTAVQNECVELLMMLQIIHNTSEISFEKLSFVIGDRFLRQKLIETTSQEDAIKTEITKILQNFDPAKDKIGCINDLMKRYEKTYSTSDNVIPSDKHTDMEDNTTTRSCKYQKETSDRMSSDNTSTKLRDENERLRKERNSAKIELQRLLRENNKSYQNLKTEQVLVREELQRREREKYELVALFKDKEYKDLQTINLYEKEIETLKSRLTGEKANQYSSYELLRTKHDLETCKHQKKALEVECNELQKENIELENELQSLNSKLEQFDDSTTNISNMKKQIKDLEEGIQQLKQKVQKLNEKIDELQKENIMLNATVDEKVCENFRLDTELQSLSKEKERTVTILQTEIDELRKELIDKHLLIDQAHTTLSRSKSLCNLTHHSKEEIKIRSNLITRMCRESNEEGQQIFKDHTETLYESTGRSKSLQSLMQNFDNDDYLPQDETGMFGSAEDVTERERTAQGIFKKLSMASKTTTTVQNNYNIITSNATFQKNCLVETTTANANSDRAITDS